MSVLDSILSDTVGIAVRAYTGKPDQWTLNNQAEQQAQDQLQAQGIDPNDSANADILAQAKLDAANSIAHTVDTQPPTQIDCSKPSTDLLTTVYCGIKKLETYVVILAIILIAGYLGIKYLERRK